MTRSRLFTALSVATLAMLASGRAHATGMQGHVYMAMCAAEKLPEGRVKKLLAENEMRLINGAFFPDSGYTNSQDPSQGEIAHWEAFVESWVKEVRKAHPDPWSDPDGRKRIAQLLGLAAHGITDSTFDSLFFDRVMEVDPGGSDQLDMSMDVFLVADLKRELIPELDHDAAFASTVFTGVAHPIAQKSVEKAMSTARSGMAAVVKVLAPAVENFSPKYPWAHASLRGAKVPGAYPFGTRVVLGYYRELEKRLDGDTSADGTVIGHYPDDELPLVALDHTRADARLAIFFGHGLDRKSLPGAVTVTDASGKDHPAKIAPYRGDEWANAIVVEPMADWEKDATYTVTVKSSIKTLYGTSPTKDYVFTFSTHCATTPDDPACTKSTASPCPLNDARFQPVVEPEEPVGTAGSGGAAGTAGGGAAAPAPAQASGEDGGCAVGPGASVGVWVLPLLALVALGRRRRG